MLVKRHTSCFERSSLDDDVSENMSVMFVTLDASNAVAQVKM